ncbi:hypothetical protein EW145_g2928 [Phellinidium pouzarii]|uniref:Multidrug resistance-associated ABC transporter n=1 Tax=Phellinidium pouzarii TaxID=167371 RepID=A0A4S4L8Y7_9AGAM|nr:hypothetical protein EW145_g2928 [Phellinidium pouzarii]
MLTPSFCTSSQSPLDLSNSCVRASWAAFVPAVLVFVFLVLSIPFPAPIRKLAAPFREFLSLEEAEALDADQHIPFTSQQRQPDPASRHTRRAPLWLTFVLSATSLLESGAWLAAGTYALAINREHTDFAGALRNIVVAFTWLYAALVPITCPTATPSPSLVSLYVAHLIGGALLLGGELLDSRTDGVSLPSSPFLVPYSLNLVATVFMLLVQLSRPLAFPSTVIDEADIGKKVSPEDYTTLWGWMSFGWIMPLIKRGTYNTLSEDDVWELSVTMRARPVFRKFSALKKSSLTWLIWSANSKDISLDFVLTFVSVMFNYSGPFFLKRIIDAIDSGAPAAHARAYLFAVLTLLAQAAKAEADVQHLWYGRRAAVRIRSELMSAIYDKALKRRDFSGIVAAKDNKNEGEKGKDDPKAGADVGKIVNLMAGDANRISMIVSGMYFIYGAPFEIIIACTFLYQLLGWSAFVGFLVLLLGWPLNSFIARRSIRIQKGLLGARDKRMGVLNELIGAIKFIKFFAWEERWIGRALEARAKELEWLVKSRFNSIMFQILWTTAPIFVSVLSFFTYVAGGRELTVGTAFTAIALFNMIRQPLNVIPAWIVQILQTRVALQRIETFLDEDEVDEQVSTLKSMRAGPRPAELNAEFGLRKASFRWNAVVEKGKDKGEPKGKDSTKGKTNGTEGNKDNDAEVAFTEEASEVPGIAAPEADHQFELHDISVVFPEGELTVITGPTASGKTAILLGLLGEMTLLPGEGRILMHKDPSRVDEQGYTHTIAYAAQTPWLQHQSIKDNILFGHTYDEARYNAVIEACALRTDLGIFEDGDATEIGARGVSLSGGQKARVALARAVYARSKYVLLDDPLSAVDSHTARFLYERLFLGPLLKNRTVILVTHHVELVLPGTQYLVRMLDGHVDVQGTVKELRARGVLESIALESALEEEHRLKDAAAEKEKLKEEADEAAAAAEGAASGEESNGEETNPADTPVKDVKERKKPRKLVKDEERETGSVKWSIYKAYLKASSYWTWVILMFLIVCIQALSFTEKFWIKVWGEAYGEATSTPLMHLFSFNAIIEQQALFSDVVSPHHFTHIHQDFSAVGLKDHLPSAYEHPLFYVGVYAAIGLFTVVISITSVATQYTGALRASRILFKQLLIAVVRATMRWHDVTPTGRMLNRFSKDIETVDSSLASSLQAVNSSLASFFSSMVIVVAVFPPFLVPASVIGYFYYQLAIGYLNTGRDLRRMESTTRSPIFSGFGELLEGIVTVRAFSAEPRFLNGLYSKIDVTLRMWYSFWMTNRWLLLRFDCLGALAVFTTTLFALSVDASTKPGWAGWAALCITSALAFTNNIYWACRFWTQLELDLNSVERVVEYLDLPQEPPAVIENMRPPAHWPSSTGPNEDRLLEVKDLEVRYAPDLPAVLHDVSFSLKARERIGLLGRTGSGKSTLAMSILRFVDPSKGQILIDGIDITSIGVHDLRARLTFIPQDAALFSGMLRDNLDPFGEYGDAACLDVLHRVQMIGESEYLSQRSSRAPSVHGISIGREEADATAVDSVPAEATGSGSGSKAGSPSRTPSETTTVADGGSGSTKGSGSGPTKISLDSDVSAGGLNFSAGQRQLIAMARALLRQSAVIVLDEATSSIDFATDAKIQQTIRDEFGGSLLLTIAHRLRTIIDYDRLIVLDAGHIAEFDTPYNLIQRESGIFRGMCLKSGSFAELEEIACAKAEQDTAAAMGNAVRYKIVEESDS